MLQFLVKGGAGLSPKENLQPDYLLNMKGKIFFSIMVQRSSRFSKESDKWIDTSVNRVKPTLSKILEQNLIQHIAG